MKKRNSVMTLLFLLILFLFTGCKNEKPAEPVKSIIPEIHTGMTSEEVFSIIGKDYDNCETHENYKNTVEYDYCIDNEKEFGTQMKGYMFFEFDKQTDVLKTFGYHLGHNGEFTDPSYPYSEEELKEVYEKIKTIVSDWYGDGSTSSDNSEYGARQEHIWQNKNEQIWLIYGINLWGLDEPEKYEKGTNEVLISCDLSSGEQSESDAAKTIDTYGTSAVNTIITSQKEILSASGNQPVTSEAVFSSTGSPAATITPEQQEIISQEREAVKAVCLDKEWYIEEPFQVIENSDRVTYKDTVEYIMHRAESYEVSDLGKITDEQDLIDKARNVYIQIYGIERVERAEADYSIKDGVKLKIERDYPKYSAKYYDEYDVWSVSDNPPSGKREDGAHVVCIRDGATFLVIRGEDGKLLGAAL